jgi:Tfp pilus assembly protein PilN
MINLLPPEIKINISYARRNTMLRKWAFALLIGIGVISSTIFIGNLFLRQSTHSLASQVEQGTEQLKIQKLEETQKQVEGISSSLKLVVQVLSREVLFSKLLQQIGSVMPSGAVLTNLSINKLQGGLDLQAAATDYQTATQVQVNLQDPANQIFDKADIVSIQCTSNQTTTGGIADQYPCTVQVRALFAKNNPFLFINNKTGGVKP